MQTRLPFPKRQPNRALKRTRGYVSAPWRGLPAAPLSSGVRLQRWQFLGYPKFTAYKLQV